MCDNLIKYLKNINEDKGGLQIYLENRSRNLWKVKKFRF